MKPIKVKLPPPGTIVNYQSNQDVDFFIIMVGGPEIPTKQDKFVQVAATLQSENQPDQSIFDLYIKRKGSTAQQQFEDELKSEIKKSLTSEHPYIIDEKLEVVIFISMTERRFKKVDIDNLLKCVLDCMTGLVYQDDCQIVSVYGHKEVNQAVPLNGLSIAVRRLKHRKSWFKNLWLIRKVSEILPEQQGLYGKSQID